MRILLLLLLLPLVLLLLTIILLPCMLHRPHNGTAKPAVTEHMCMLLMLLLLLQPFSNCLLRRMT